ncbi:MAG: domain containing protein [Myxococcales bacterium]|nr:domain containing protein [Myxococcales bacterium]
MGGERLESSELTDAGIPGDRVVHVENARGRVLTSRSRPRLLLHRGTIGTSGEPLVDGRPWRDAKVAHDVQVAAGEDATLVESIGLERFDVLPLLITTDGAVASLGYDGRRFRPNLVIGGVEGLEERDWEGRRLALGAAIIRAVDLRQRCIMTTFDPDTGVQDVSVLRTIQRTLDGTLGLNCRIETAGRVRVGDPVHLLPAAP